METYIVTGIVQFCIYSQWSEMPARVEVRGMDREAAIAAALELHQRAAERQDPYAIARWHTPELVSAVLRAEGDAEHSTLSTMTTRESMAQDNKTVI